jgi:hypothetical protein
MSKMTLRSSKKSYQPISVKKSRKNFQSPLSPSRGTFKTVPSFDTDSIYQSIDISEFSQISMADILKNAFMTVDKSKGFDRFFNLVETKIDLIEKFQLSGYNFNKDLIYPATLINIMTRLNNLKISNFDIKLDEPDLYTGYGSKNGKKYVLTIFDTIGIKALFLIYHDNVLYLSPLNIRNTRDIIRKNILIDLDIHFIAKNNRDLRKKFNVKSNINSINIDASLYDIVVITEGHDSFLRNPNNIQIHLNNFNNEINYKSSILVNNKISGSRNGHMISVNKCYDYTIVNTTWKPLNTYNIESFIPGNKKFYYINSVNRTLNEVSSHDVISQNLEYYYSHFIDQMNIYISIENMHFYTSKHKQKYTGGVGSVDIDYSKAIPPVSVCSGIYFPHNLHGFCWFSSVINSLFFADDISIIFLNRAVRNMDKTLEYIKYFYDSGYITFNIDNELDLKEFTKHLIYLFTYVYTSFSILSKNQLNRIKNKRKWFEIYNKILNEYYHYIYIYIIVLSKTMRIDYATI